jgi:hypothetical protein
MPLPAPVTIAIRPVAAPPGDAPSVTARPRRLFQAPSSSAGHSTLSYHRVEGIGSNQGRGYGSEVQVHEGRPR